MAEPWIRVHARLATKPVILRASQALGVNHHEAMGLMVEFWSAISQTINGGRVGELPDSEIERFAGWTRKRGKFATFVRAHHLDGDGRIRDWDEFQGKLEARREYDRNRKRNSAGNPPERERNSGGNSEESGAEFPTHTRGLRGTKRNETKETATPTKKPSSPNPDVDAVLAHYVRVHPTGRPGDKARKIVRRALGWGYTAAELCAAIDGNSIDPWHVKETMHGLSYVFRDGDQIDRFRTIAAKPLVDEFGVPTEHGKRVTGVLL